MSWEFYPAQAAFLLHAADWDRLNGELCDSHPYFDSRFVGPLLKHFGDGREYLCLYRVNGVVGGALILEPRGGGRWRTFRPAQAQITPLLVADAGQLKSLFKVLPGFAWSIEFQAVDPRYAPEFSCIHAEAIISTHATTIGIDPQVRFEPYWSQRPKNLRSNIRRYTNRLEREASLPELLSLTKPETMNEGVRRFGELESAGWKAATSTAVSINNSQGRFYAEVLARFAATGQAEICELTIGRQLAASRLLIGNVRMLVILKTTYDEAMARYAPSRLLLHSLLERQFGGSPVRTIEFYTNATRDQAEWATFSSTIQNVQLFRNEGTIVPFSLIKAFKQRLVDIGRTLPKTDDQGLEVEVRSSASIDALARESQSLNDLAPRDSIENSLDWFALLHKQVYPDDPNVRYYYVTERGKPKVILPLRQTIQGGVRTLESLSNYYTSLYSPLISNESDLLVLQQLLSTATRENSGTHVMRFAPMAPESPCYAALINGLRATGWVPLTFFCFGNWFLKVDGDWEDYLRKRSANLRSSIKRRNREFVADGGTLEVVSGPENLEAAIAAFQQVYSASWKKPEPYPNFVPSLIRLLAAKGMLRLGIARLRGQPIAAQLWIAGPGKASIYKVAYHHAYASLSPGTVLTSYLLRQVIEQDKVREVDFLIGDDEYKKIWMSHRRERWGIVAFNPRTIVGCILIFKEVAGRMAKSVGQELGPMLSRTQAAISATMRRPDEAQTARGPNTSRDQIMDWTILPIQKFKEHSEQWNALVRSRLGTPFLESAFLSPLLDVFGTGGEYLCLLHDNGRLIAAAIMQRGRKAIWQTFQPSQLPLGAWVTDGHVDLPAACRSLLLELPGMTLALGASQVDPRLQQRPEDSARVRTQDYIATAWVDIDSSFDTYWEARGKNLKQNTRKQHNKLQAEGVETRIECITSPELVAAAIEDYGQLESAGWKGADGTAISPDNDQGRFYRTMLENYCTQGRGRIYRYWFGDKVVAMDLCIHDDAVLVILKTAYDESYKSVSPSTLMRHDQFQQLFAERRFRRIEFFGKVMEWHTRWTSQSRTIYHATAYRWTWLKELHARRAVANAIQAPVTRTED